MGRKLIRRIIGVAAISLSVGAIPARASGPGFTNAVQITVLFPREIGLDIILPGSGNPLGCSNADAYRLPLNADNYNAIASTLVTAFSSNKPIKVWAQQCDAADGASKILAVYVPK